MKDLAEPCRGGTFHLSTVDQTGMAHSHVAATPSLPSKLGADSIQQVSTTWRSRIPCALARPEDWQGDPLSLIGLGPWILRAPRYLAITKALRTRRIRSSGMVMSKTCRRLLYSLSRLSGRMGYLRASALLAYWPHSSGLTAPKYEAQH